ncbi:MAG TPA: PAS domain-containing protein, partial [Geobacteraceae bacterium]|nr:PAS domain-containing protein [Geobacteraceae bacterium]
EKVLLGTKRPVLLVKPEKVHIAHHVDEQEAIGQSLDLIIPERQRELHWKGYGKAMLDGVTKYGSETLSVPAVTKDGERISIEFTINLIRDGDGKVLGPVAVVRDVTARWTREKDLRQRLAFLEAGQTTL